MLTSVDGKLSDPAVEVLPVDVEDDPGVEDEQRDEQVAHALA